jgi:hypothetical protein
MIQAVKGGFFGYLTQTAGTVINRLVPPFRANYTRVSTLKATSGAAGQTVTAYRNLGHTTFTAAGAPGQAVVNIAAQPFAARNLAANDYVAISETDGVCRLYQVSSVSALAVTLTSNLVAGVAGGGDFWFMGKAANTDLDVRTGLVQQVFNLPGTAQSVFSETDTGAVSSLFPYEPILLQHNNAGTAGSIDHVVWGYTAS